MKFYFEIDPKQKKKHNKILFCNNYFFSNYLNTPKYFFLLKRLKIVFLILLLAFLYIASCKISKVQNLFYSFMQIPNVIISLFKYFMPSIMSLKYSKEIATSYFKTLIIALSSTTFAAFFALIFAIFASNLTKKYQIISFLITAFASFCRALPLPAWVILFLFSFGQNEFTGFFVLFIVTFGALTRIFKELIDSTSKNSFLALKAIGAPYISAIINGVIPNIKGQFVSWLLYSLSTNIRDSALVGILTGSGLGFLFNLFFRSFRYDAAGLVVLILTLTVLCFDFFANKARDFIFNAREEDKERNAKWVFLPLLILILIIISILSLFFIKGGDNGIVKEFNSLFANIFVMFFSFNQPITFSFTTLFNSCFVSISLAFLTTFLSSIISFFISIFNTKMVIKCKFITNIIEAIFSFIRAIPTIIWVMLFSVCLGVGPVATIIGLSLHSIAYLVYAFSSSFNSVNKNTLDSLTSCGASRFVIFTGAILPSSIKSIVSWSFFRFEINFMNVVALGSAAGAGGIGYELFIAGSMEFDIKTVGIISYFLLFISLILETISNKIKKRL